MLFNNLWPIAVKQKVEARYHTCGRKVVNNCMAYVYKMTHKTTGEFYIGVRWGNKVPPNEDLGVKYRTSSKIVKPRFDEFYGEILVELGNHEEAIDLEQTLIEEHWGNPLLLNKAIQVSKKFRCTAHSEETKAKMSASKKGKPPNNKGKKVSQDSIERMRKAHTGKVKSIESKDKMRQASLGSKNPNFGKKLSDEQKMKLSKALLAVPKLHCEHCGREFRPGPYALFHGPKCKLRK